jgi:hypothetical protein
VRRLTILALAWSAGCTPLPTSDEPRAGIRVVAVLPFVDQTSGSSFDADEAANLMASELVKIAGVRVVRPAQIRAGLEVGESLATVNDAVRIGRRVRADAVLACAITDYDPYDPPKIGISVQFLRVAAHPLTSQDLDRMLQSASWKSGPLPMTPDKAGHVLALFEDVYDSQDGRTRGDLINYARKQAGGGSAFAHEREFLAVQSRYLQFVSGRVAERAWESHGP